MIFCYEDKKFAWEKKKKKEGLDQQTRVRCHITLF